MKKALSIIVLVTTAIIFFSSCGSTKDRCPKVYEADYQVSK